MEGYKEFKSSIDTILDKKFEYPVTVKEDYEGEALESITFSNLKVGTVIRLQPFLVKIPQLDNSILKSDDITGGSLFKNEQFNFKGEQLKIIGENIDNVIEITCIAIWNKAGDYPEWWPEFFKWNFDLQELYGIIRMILSMIHGPDFINSITELANSMTLIKEGEMKIGLTRCYSRSTV